MDKKTKKKVKNYILGGLAVVIVALLALLPTLTASVEDGAELVTLSGTAETGSIADTLAGGGTLTEQKGVAVSVPSGVEVTEYLVNNGDYVSEGDPVALVDRVSVMTAITETQEKLGELSEEIEDAADESAEATITAQTSARVKAVYASEGDDVRAVMQEHGVLAVLSLDGRMAVSFESDAALRGGQAVKVMLSDETELDGRIESNLDGVVTVTLTDDGPAIGETATILSENGDVLGEGELYVHSPWNAVAFAGEVSKVKIEPEDTVKAGAELMELTGSEYSAEYTSLTNQHRVYETILEELFVLYQDAKVKATATGCVSGVDENALKSVAYNGQSVKLVLLSAEMPADNSEPETEAPTETDDPAETNTPTETDDPTTTDDPAETNTPPETDAPSETETPTDTGGSNEPDDTESDANYVNQVGMVVAIGDNGAWMLSVQPNTISVTDYTELGEISTLVETMTESASYIPDAPIYSVTGESRTQIGAGSVKAGDVLLFAIDGDKVLWIDVIGHYDIPGTDTDTDSNVGSGEMGDSTGGTTTNTDMSGFDMSSLTGGNISGLTAMSGMSGMSGLDMSSVGSLQDMYPNAAVQEQQAMEEALKKTVLSVIPQETMTIQITVDEFDISRLAPGQTADVAVDALPGFDFEGVVVQVGGNAQNKGGNTKYPVTILMDRMDLMLDDMNASAIITLDEHVDVLMIPVAALYDDGTDCFVYTSYDEQTGTLGDPVYVTTGVTDGVSVEILSGLSEGDTYWYSYYDSLS